MIKLSELLREEGIVSKGGIVSERSLSAPVRDTISYLKNNGGKVLFITTSTRYPFNTQYDKGGVELEIPKSTELALFMKKSLPNESEWIDIPQLKIHPCEGNVSHVTGNTCGVVDSLLKDKSKNPSGLHRCWASVNDKSDELWKVSKRIFEADTVLFFGSIRWGQANGEYQKLIERLTWLENRHSTLGESNVLEGKKAGFICIGQNWNGANVTLIQKDVLSFFGFDTPDNLFWNWQYTNIATDETQESYKMSHDKFHQDLGMPHVEPKEKKSE